jgi:endonuclease VIII
MPEGHTIHRLAKDHTKDLVGKRLDVTSPQGRMADDAAIVDGHVLRGVDPYGKHLFYRFDHDVTIHVHLGLFGKFRRQASPAADPIGQVRMRLSGPSWTVDLSGPTDCRIITSAEEQTIRDRLGPDPLRKDADPDRAWERIKKRRSTIGEALMDQKVMAGVGNVYRAESLFLHGIHPNRAANTVTKPEFDALWVTLVDLLNRGVKDNRIITLEPSDLAELGPRRRLRSKEAVYVYKQPRCRRCHGDIARWDLAGRWAYACETCQRP